jgi:hypothetical protein
MHSNRLASWPYEISMDASFTGFSHDANEKAKQQQQQHDSLLAFLARPIDNHTARG